MMDHELASNGEDCGIEGDPDAFVTVHSFNRFVRVAAVGHVRPIHRDLESLKKWNNNADLVIAKITGGLMAIKILAFVVLFSIASTFAATVWMMSKLAEMLAK